MVAETQLTVPSGSSEVTDHVVTAWLVDEGATVSAGQPLVVLAVDKGDIELPAPADGRVETLHADAHQTVQPGDVLVTLVTLPDASDPSGGPAEGPSQHGGATPPPQDDRQRVEPLTRIRKRIAHHMMTSLATTAQLTAVVEVDMTRAIDVRTRHKEDFRSMHGVGLSPFTLSVRAAVQAATRHPVINASIDTKAGTATYHRDVHLGVAVETPNGLLVPTVREAQELTVAGLAKRIGDLAKRARSGALKPDDLTGGTFTVTNTGSLGTLLGTPILSPPNVAILGTYTATRRAVVVEDDRIALRWMSYFCLTYDHQLIDGADAARYLQDVKHTVETHDFASELGL